jgi:hypothetical protein
VGQCCTITIIGDFRQFLAKKTAFFLQSIVMICTNFEQTRSSFNKTRQILRQIFGKNIF